MKGVRFTKAELVYLRASISGNDKLGASIVAKLNAAEAAPSGVSVKPIEEALIKASRGKVIPLESGHAIASRRLTTDKVTVEAAELVGGWMGRQQWLTGPMTVLDVLNKWHQWLPKARATQPPPGLPAGLGTSGQEQKPGAGSATSSGSPQGRRPPQGFR